MTLNPTGTEHVKRCYDF